MSRSNWKPAFIHAQIALENKNKEEKDVVIFNRSTVLTEDFLGYRFHIYNGVRFFSIEVDGDKLGHRLGEFAPTKKKPIPKKKKK